MIYASRTLTETEQRYSNIERELLAVVFALERLNHYTAGFRVQVETDHQPLTSIWKKPIASTSARIQRLLLRLLQYDIDIHYLLGKMNVIADALSRVSPLPPKPTDVKAMNCIAENELSVNIPASQTKMEEFQHYTIVIQLYKNLLNMYIRDGPENRRIVQKFYNNTGHIKYIDGKWSSV